MKESDTRMHAIPAVYIQEAAERLFRSIEAEKEKQETSTYKRTAKARMPLLLRRLVGSKTAKYQIKKGIATAAKINHESFTLVKE
jgi:transketolase N-terminal domain/subunit